MSLWQKLSEVWYNNLQVSRTASIYFVFSGIMNAWRICLSLVVSLWIHYINQATLHITYGNNPTFPQMVWQSSLVKIESRKKYCKLLIVCFILSVVPRSRFLLLAFPRQPHSCSCIHLWLRLHQTAAYSYINLLFNKNHLHIEGSFKNNA